MEILKKNIALLLLPLLLSWVLTACNGNEGPLPPNPYDEIDYGEDTSSTPPPDPASITGLHQNIFAVKCNNPGCHDGTFEPDFRTVQSTWSTLVYHNLKKNTADEAYTFRVVPYDTGQSILVRRVTKDEPALQRMPATGDYLSPQEMENLVDWIEGGALDMFGNPGVLPNNEPVFIGYLVFDSAYQRIDTVRVDDIFYMPMLVDHNKSVKFVCLVEDDSTDVSDLTNVKIKFSYDIDNFTGATTVPAYFFTFPGFNVWVMDANTGDYPADTTVYFRFYYNDGDHVDDSEFPTDDHEEGYKTYSAMKIRP